MQPDNATVLHTDRLSLRRMSLDDAGFIVELLNDPAFLRFIGDKGVRTLDAAREYILKGPIDSYGRYGFGLYAVCLRDGTPIGICGLVNILFFAYPAPLVNAATAAAKSLF